MSSELRTGAQWPEPPGSGAAIPIEAVGLDYDPVTNTYTVGSRQSPGGFVLTPSGEYRPHPAPGASMAKAKMRRNPSTDRVTVYG